MVWTVVMTDEAQRWLLSLNEKDERMISKALFALRRRAVVLLGGDKSGDWSAWYERNVPRADALYDEYLDRIHEEG